MTLLSMKAQPEKKRYGVPQKCKLFSTIILDSEQNKYIQRF
jgi:hypothetical protein